MLKMKLEEAKYWSRDFKFKLKRSMLKIIILLKKSDWQKERYIENVL